MQILQKSALRGEQSRAFGLQGITSARLHTARQEAQGGPQLSLQPYRWLRLDQAQTLGLLAG